MPGRRSLLGVAVTAAAIVVVMPVAAAPPLAAGAERELPDLVQESPAQLDIRVARTAEGRRFRLGFRSAVHNAGAGPLVIEARRRDRRQQRMIARQLVRHADGRLRAVGEVGALRYTRSRDHRHWHLLRFDDYELWRGDTPVRAARKAGFCLRDRYFVDRFAVAPRDQPRPAWRGHCGRDRPDLLTLRQGISPGFGDDYPPHVEGQHVDVTGLPAGDYDLVHRVNADRVLLESDYSNNAACLGVRLGWPRGTQRSPSARIRSCAAPPPSSATMMSRGASGSIADRRPQ